MKLCIECKFAKKAKHGDPEMDQWFCERPEYRDVISLVDGRSNPRMVLCLDERRDGMIGINSSCPCGLSAIYFQPKHAEPPMPHSPEVLLDRALCLIQDEWGHSREEALEWLNDDSEDWVPRVHGNAPPLPGTRNMTKRTTLIPNADAT